MEKGKRWGASPAVRFMRQGDKAARVRTCTAVLVPLQHIGSYRGASGPDSVGQPFRQDRKYASPWPWGHRS